MKVIRKMVFETNSSSTHSMTIMSPEEFKQWQNGEILKEPYGDKFIKKDEMDKFVEKYYKDNEASLAKYYDINEFDKEAVEEKIQDDGEMPQTYDEYCDDEFLEVDVSNHETQGGEKMIIVCKYGRDC